MCDELGITAVIDQATQQDPAMRIVTAGHAVTALVLNGLGFLNHPRYLVPHFCQTTPLSRLIAPGMQASHLHDDTLGRALDTLSATGGTALSSLIAATAARRLGLTPTCGHLDTPSFPGDGRYNSAEPPEEQGVHITPGSSRAHRPALNHVMVELRVEPQAGIPVLLQPRRGQRHDGTVCGHVVSAHMAQLHPTYGAPSLVADRALESADHLQQLAETRLQGIPRVPATWRAAQAVLAQAAPQTMVPLQEGYRYRGVPSRYGGVAQHWMLLHSAPRQPQAQRTVATQWLQHRAQEANAVQTRCRTALACAADAQQALTRFAHDVQTTLLPASPVCRTPHDGKRGRPGSGAQPDQIVSQIAGALASRLTDRPALVDQQRCVLLATHALDEEQLSAQAVLDGYKTDGVSL